MSIKKILAASLASVAAVSAMAVVAFADGEKAISYTEEWTDVKIIDDAAPDVTALLGDAAPEDVESITFTSQGVTKWCIGANTVGDKDWTQTDSAAFSNGEGGDWFGDGSVVTVPAADIDWTRSNLCFKLGVNEATGEDSKVTWVVNMKAADAATDDTAADTATDTTDAAVTTDAAAPSEANSDTGVEGIAAVLGVAAVAAGAMIVAKKRK